MSLTNYTIKMNNNAGRLALNAGSTLSLRNVVRDSGSVGAQTVAELSDVAVVNKVDNAALVYDSANGRYEIRLANLDGGTF
jgi:hypothetical protein